MRMVIADEPFVATVEVLGEIEVRDLLDGTRRVRVELEGIHPEFGRIEGMEVWIHPLKAHIFGEELVNAARVCAA